MAARIRSGGCALVLAAAFAAGVSAQGGGKPLKGNPTPGTAQPDPPSLADRITLTGCVQPTPGRSTSAVDENTPSDTRFILTRAERRDVTPPGTGGSAAASSASGRAYRLEAIESQLSAFVGTKVEVSGEVKPRPARITRRGKRHEHADHTGRVRSENRRDVFLGPGATRMAISCLGQTWGSAAASSASDRACSSRRSVVHSTAIPTES